ncbi:MAG: TIGR04086 family membrane protein [Candidatus Limivivens sp.]|nr:TIGR04086 family membrane protein [Candidatus Limivivens sp.]
MENSQTGKSRLGAVLKGLLLSFLTTALLLVLLAFFLFKLELDEQKVAAGIILIYIVSSFLGGWLAGRKSVNRKFLWGMVTGCAYFVVLLGISLAGEGGTLSAIRVFTTLLMCLGGGMLGGMLS